MATLSQLLALPGLGLRLIQAGPGDPEITWGSTTELLDLSEYLEGGEIIMTTGLALGADDPRWRDFAASLNRARVAAIGFGVGVNHDRVPAPLVRAASEYRVALIEIPLPTPFIAVTKAVAALLRTDELRSARGALQAQQRILAGARGEDQRPAEVLANISQATGRQLALLAHDGAVIAATAGFAAADGAGTERIALDEERTLQLAVAAGAPLRPEGHAVIAAGSMVLGLGLHGDRAAEKRERERWGRLVRALLAGEASAGAYRVLVPVGDLPERVRAIAVQGRAEDIFAWRRRPRAGLERLVGLSTDAPRAPGLGAAWQICADAPEALEAALAQAAAHGLDAAVGRPAALEEIPLSRRSAAARQRALSPTAPLYAAPRTPVVLWADRDAPLLEALLSVDGAGAAGAGGRRALGARVLGPLSRWHGDLPEAERATLRDTLRALFEADGQRGPAAAALGIHRNTLRDRLARIERLTDRSLGDADDRAELWLALRLEELAEI